MITKYDQSFFEILDYFPTNSNNILFNHEKYDIRNSWLKSKSKMNQILFGSHEFHIP